MTVKKWITISTFFLTLITCVSVLCVDKEISYTCYDISLAIFGSSFLAFIISVIEYFNERKKSMETFYKESREILYSFRKIEYLDIDEPIELICNALQEERNNEYVSFFVSNSKNEAKLSLMSWYEEKGLASSFNLDPNDSNISEKYAKELEKLYQARIETIKHTIKRISLKYITLSELNFDDFQISYDNLNFIFGNTCLLKNATDHIYTPLNNLNDSFCENAYHLKRAENLANYAVCLRIISQYNDELFNKRTNIKNGHNCDQVFQDKFDNTEEALEKFKCKIYFKKYKGITKIPVSGNWVFFEG